MLVRAFLTSASAAALAALVWSAPSHALTMGECSTKYKEAKSSGTLQGMSWNQFRKAQCGTQASASPTPSASTPSMPSATKRGPASSSSTVGVGSAVFPSAVSSKYAKEKAGRARMHTCLDQYNANKAGNGNGGLRWIQKGGGYYSECNKRLSQQ